MREALQNNCHKHHYAEQRLPGTLLFERKIAFSGLQPRKPFLAFQKGDTFHRMGRGGGPNLVPTGKGRAGVSTMPWCKMKRKGKVSLW